VHLVHRRELLPVVGPVRGEQPVVTRLARLGGFARFVGRVVRAGVRQPPPLERVLDEAYAIGVRSLPILLLVSTFVGTNLVVQGASAFRPLGGGSLVGMFVALAGVREMAPIMVASMVAAKAGTEMASQIAVLRTGEQIDALEVMAVDPYGWLVVPRLLGILLVLPALTVIGIFTLLAAATTVAWLQIGLDPTVFLHEAAKATQMVHIGYCALKAAAFAVVICLVSCWCGFSSEPGPSGVGRATNRAVVIAAVGCAVLNYVLSQVLFGR
jgi:phospholipid/cholesterol/gamma-HCH transport system permease protein